MKYVVAAVVLLTILGGYLAWFMIVTAAHDPADWHVNPLTVPTSATPNDFRIAMRDMTEERVDAEPPIYSERPLILAQAFDQFAFSQRDTNRIAGLPPELMMTYVQHTATLKMPDYLTIKFIDLGDGTSTVAIYSRSRFGYGDMGMNQRRAESWIKALDSFVASKTAAEN